MIHTKLQPFSEFRLVPGIPLCQGSYVQVSLNFGIFAKQITKTQEITFLFNNTSNFWAPKIWPHGTTLEENFTA